MKRVTLFSMFMLALLAIACQKNSGDNNRSLEFSTLDVKFGGVLAGKSWMEGDEIGVYSFCTRNEEPNISMSPNAHARYIVRTAGEKAFFVNGSENDMVIANATDHNFRFYAYYPYSAANNDMTAINAEVPALQEYSRGVGSYGLYVANQQATTILPTLELNFRAVFSIVDLHIPNDILDEDGHSHIRSLTLKPSDGADFDGVLANGGRYDLKNGVFTSDPAKQADSVKLDFGEAGLVLSDAFTKVSLAVAPFTVPEGGMVVKLVGMDGNTVSINILGEASDAGQTLAAGEVFTQYLSRDNDGVIPVSFPVIFPLGKPEGQAVFTAATQPRWVTEGIWICPSQTQAYAQWKKVSDPSPTATQFLETVNSGDVSSPGVKGIWTGDYFEFVLPVKKFAAGTAVTIKFPMYTRQGPVFWNIEYLDGDEWKSNKTNITSYDPDYTREATFSLIRGGKIIEHTMVFTKAIQSGAVKIRITCADGTIQADTDTKVAVRTTPWLSGGAYGAPFYLYLAGSDVSSVSFDIN